MKRILIGYDGSPQADGAMEDLSRAGLPLELDATVLTVADVWMPTNPIPGSDISPSTRSGPVRQARERAEQAVASARAAAARAGEHLHSLFPKWRIETVATADSPAWGILNRAAEWKADLIVMGSHGRSTLERIFLGSVSQKVAAEAGCSVRIARPRINPHHARLRVLLAVDGSADSQIAVREIAGRVWPDYCQFRVVGVVDSRLESSVAWPELFGQGWVPQPDEDAAATLKRVVEADAERLRSSGLMVETHVARGDAKGELLAHAEKWEADCIFVGARGLHHGGRLALGTVASAVTGRAHCSVEIVRPN